MKNNYGPVAHKLVLKYRNGLYLPIAGETTIERAAREQRSDKVFRKLLRKLDDKHQPVSPSRTSPNYAPKIFMGLEEGKAYIIRDHAAAMQRLLDRRLIHIGEFGPRCGHSIS